MVKDRLNELKMHQNRNSKKGNTAIQIESNNNANSDPQNEYKKLRETFERTEVVRQWIVQMEKNNQDIRLYLRRVDDMKYNQKDVDEKLRSIFQNNTTIAHQISGKLKEVDDEMNKLRTQSAEGRIKHIQYTTSKTRFQKAFADNNKLLEDYRNIQKQMIKSQLQAKGISQVTDEELTSLLDEGADLQVFTENLLAETAEAKRVLADVEERHQQLLEIERMLTEVRDLFVQMSILIDSQQELIDRIEFQAQNATDYIGAVDLAAVRRSKKKYMKRKIYLFLIIAVVLILVLILVFKS